MKQSKETLKEHFETGDKPTQVQYSDLIDSYIDSKQEAGETNRRFVIDETGEVNVTSEIEIPEYTLSEIKDNKLSLLKDGEVVTDIDLTTYLDDTSYSITETKEDGNIIGHFKNDEKQESTEIKETITSLSINGNTINYQKEDGTIDSIPIPTSSSEGNSIDIEEGAFTPKLDPEIYSWSNTEGTYIRIGNLVRFTCKIRNINKIGDFTEKQLRISCLPYLAWSSVTGDFERVDLNIRIHGHNQNHTSFYTTTGGSDNIFVHSYHPNNHEENGTSSQFSSVEFTNGYIVISGTYTTDTWGINNPNDLIDNAA